MRDPARELADRLQTIDLLDPLAQRLLFGDVEHGDQNATEVFFVTRLDRPMEQSFKRSVAVRLLGEDLRESPQQFGLVLRLQSLDRFAIDVDDADLLQRRDTVAAEDPDCRSVRRFPAPPTRRSGCRLPLGANPSRSRKDRRD